MVSITEKLNRPVTRIVTTGAIFLLISLLLFWHNPSIESALILSAFVVFAGLVMLLRDGDENHVDRDERIIQEHKLILESITHTPLPFAIYDAEDRLVVHNPAYKSLYKQAFANLRKRGRQKNIHYSELVRETLPNDIPADQIDELVEARVRRQRETVGIGFDRDYPEMGWHRVTKYETPSGALAGIAVDITELKQREIELTAEIDLRESLQERLTELARTDSLTNILNRRAFLQTSKHELLRQQRYKHELSLLMIDIDHFKTFNDGFGHPYGDRVIQSVVRNITDIIRTNIDIFGRMGGEEFAILLPESDCDGALRCAERIRLSIAESDPPTVEEFRSTRGNKPPRITVSIGISSLTKSCTSELETVIANADRALYRAKSAGRNRIEIHSARAD